MLDLGVQMLDLAVQMLGLAVRMLDLAVQMLDFRSLRHLSLWPAVVPTDHGRGGRCGGGELRAASVFHAAAE